MAYVIWLDEEGVETRRTKKARGRPPKGSERRKDGNWYVVPGVNDTLIYAIILDPDGNVLSKEPKGRGRPKPGFEKKDDGHWYKTENSSPVEA